MKKLAFLAGLVCVALGGAPLGAAPKPLNAASPTSGKGCLVRGSSTQAYVSDPACDYHAVTKNDTSGHLVFYRYQDKGTLQPGQAAPDKALKLDVTLTLFGQTCTGTEVITPSGNYSSNMTCK